MPMVVAAGVSAPKRLASVNRPYGAALNLRRGETRLRLSRDEGKMVAVVR
jgi:hypothetical protein